MDWGLEIAPGRARLAAARCRPAGLRVARGAAIALPGGLVLPSFTRRNVADPARLGRLLRRLADVAGCRGWVRLVLPDQVFSLRTILAEDAALAEDETGRYLRWRARELLPFGPEETRLDFLPGIVRPEGVVRYPCLFARDGVLAEYEKALELAGLRAARLDARSLALAQAAASRLAVGTRALLTLRADRMTLLVLQDGRPRFWRTVALPAALGPLELARLHREVTDSVLFCHQTEGTGAIEEVLLDGEPLLVARVVEGLSTWLEMPAVALAVEDLGKLSGTEASEALLAWAPALGAAVAPLSAAPRPRVSRPSWLDRVRAGVAHA